MYEITKAEGEFLVTKLAVERKFNYSIIRPSIVFSNDMPNQSIRNLVRTIKNNKFVFFANGSNVYLNYVHADDVAKCIFDSAVNGICLNSSAIISSDISLSDFYHMVISESGVKWYRYYIPGFIVYPFVLFFARIGFSPISIGGFKALTNNSKYKSDIKINRGVFFDSLKSFIRSIK
jgi:nucleoside-diphosphate-sugar epimerase